MWTTRTLQQSERSIQLQVLEQVVVLSVGQVIELWKNSPAFYWELPPLRHSERERAFEFIVIDSPPLARSSANPHPFREQFDDSLVCHFCNLGRDAELIVLTPQGAMEHYAHLAAFARPEASTQQDRFWQLVGERYAAALTDAPRSLSTAELVVARLHLLIDQRPKYYRHRPYREG